MLAEQDITPKLFTPQWFVEGLFTVIMVEIVIGGGGHFFEIGPLTLRMVLYFIAVPVSFFYVHLRQDIPQYVFYLLSIFTVLLIMASVTGALNGAPAQLIFEDVKIIMYFYLLLFFSIAISGNRMIDRVRTIIKYSSLFLTLIYLSTVLLITFGAINFLEFYHWMTPFNEVFFRGDGGFFIYKGFIYLCVGFIFWVMEKSFVSKVIAVLMFLAIISTFTRGFLISTLAVYALYHMFINRNKWMSIVIILFATIAVVIALPFYIETLGDRDESDIVRVIQLQQVGERTDIVNAIVGNGFGIGVPIRPVHFEIAYLEVFAKQGIVGLLFWFGLLVYLTFLYQKVSKIERYFKTATTFYLSLILIYIQSFTNPFLTNPIGLGLVLATIVIFNRMIQINEATISSE